MVYFRVISGFDFELLKRWICTKGLLNIELKKIKDEFYKNEWELVVNELN